VPEAEVVRRVASAFGGGDEGQGVVVGGVVVGGVVVGGLV